MEGITPIPSSKSAARGKKFVYLNSNSLVSARSAFDDHDLLTVIQADRQQCDDRR